MDLRQSGLACIEQVCLVKVPAKFEWVAHFIKTWSQIEDKTPNIFCTSEFLLISTDRESAHAKDVQQLIMVVSYCM